MNIFNKIILIFFVVLSTQAFGMQRIKNILRQSIGSNNSQTVPELTFENIEKYPQFKEQFAKEIKSRFAELCSTKIFRVFLSKNPKYSLDKEFIQLSIEHSDKVDHYALYMILTDSRNMNLLTQKFKNNFNQLCSKRAFDVFLYYNNSCIEEFVELIIDNLDAINLDTFIYTVKDASKLVAKKFKDDFSKHCSNYRFFIFLSRNPGYIKDFSELAMQHLDKINTQVLDIIYEHSEETEKNKILTLLLQAKKQELENIDFKLTVADLLKNLTKFNLPPFLIEHLMKDIKFVGKHTLTKHHAFSNLAKVSKMLNTDSTMFNGQVINKEKFKDPEVQNFLLNIYKVEKEEHAKGNYLFYHGRSKDIRFAGEIHKQILKLISSFTSTSEQHKEYVEKLDNFIFMRFGSKDKAVDQRNDYFFMNHSLFGNAHETTGASTLTGYWLRNHSAHFRPTDLISTKNLFSLKKYLNELDKLQELHDKASEHGEIVAVSITPDKLHLVQPCGPGGRIVHVNVINGDTGEITTDAKTILDALSYDANNVRLQDGKSADYLEWKLPLEDSYALDPINGPRFYSFYFMDEKSQKEYEDYRDEIFARIKRDIENEETSGVKKIISKL